MVSRREFLRRSAIVVAGAAAAGSVEFLPIESEPAYRARMGFDRCRACGQVRGGDRFMVAVIQNSGDFPRQELWCLGCRNALSALQNARHAAEDRQRQVAAIIAAGGVYGLRVAPSRHTSDRRSALASPSSDRSPG